MNYAKKFIAISPKGHEFFFRTSLMIAVPEGSAKKIAEDLNKAKYKIKEGEIWSVHENDSYRNDMIRYQIKKRSGTLRIYRY